MKFMLLLAMIFSSSISASGFDIALERAMDGDINAQFEVGMMHELGKIVPRDNIASRKWLRRASKKGHHEAQFELAKILIEEGLPADRPNPEALMWLKRSSEGKNYLAQIELGKAYHLGWYGAKKDEKLASNFLTIAGVKYQKKAIKGNAEAQYLWGQILYDGLAKYVQGYNYIDDDLDEERALKWFIKSAEQGNTDAMNHAGAIYMLKNTDRTAFGRRMALQSHYKEALKWFKRAAEKQHIDAIQWLSGMYEDGHAVSIDRAKSFALDYEAALLGDARSQFKVAEKYSLGDGISRDFEKAYVWALLAGNNRHYKFVFASLNEPMYRVFPANDLKIKLENHLDSEEIKNATILAATCFESLYQKCP